MLNKNIFDAALRLGVRKLILTSDSALRKAEHDTFNRLLNDQGQFLEGACTLRDCPLCGESFRQGAPEMSAHGMQLIRCPVCHLVYSREVINREFERERYTTSSASEANVALKENAAYAVLERDKAIYAMARLQEYAGEEGKLLDVGSSTGALLSAAQKKQWHAYGIEINPEAVRISQANGHSVFCGEFPCELPAGWGPFNAIALFDVLEHIADPSDFLATLSEQIPIGGWLMVQVPNYRSLLLAVEGAQNNNICHGHWSYFEEQSLLKLMQKAGYEVRFFETYITELDRVLAYSDQEISAAWLKLTRSVLDYPRELTVDKLHEYLLGYKLFGLFQKVSA